MIEMSVHAVTLIARARDGGVLAETKDVADRGVIDKATHGILLRVALCGEHEKLENRPTGKLFAAGPQKQGCHGRRPLSSELGSERNDP
jgi:hypothetical protein